MKYVFALALVLPLMSCKEEVANDTPVNFTKEEVVLNDVVSSDGYGIKNRSRLPLVDVLYQDAKTRDKKLKSLDDLIRNMPSLTSDSLENFQAYKRYNESYYKSAMSYVGNIKDTTKRAAVRAILTASDKEFSKSIKAYDNPQKKINELQNTLADQHLIMKLLVSEHMIKAYQKQLLSLQTFEHLENKYEEIIKETESYAK